MLLSLLLPPLSLIDFASPPNRFCQSGRVDLCAEEEGRFLKGQQSLFDDRYLGSSVAGVPFCPSGAAVLQSSRPTSESPSSLQLALCKFHRLDCRSCYMRRRRPGQSVKRFGRSGPTVAEAADSATTTLPSTGGDDVKLRSAAACLRSSIFLLVSSQ